jgi:predicted N-formylglutamate amidohydrolase
LIVSVADSPPGSSRLLAAGDPEPVIVTREGGACPLLLLGDHAGRAIPAKLGRLGLTGAEMERHIAWDIGIAGLGRRLSAMLDACFVEQVYSRLVIDCNRKPGQADLAPAISDETTIPGNQNLSPLQLSARMTEIYAPYQNRIGDVLDRRGAGTIIVSLHSFTPAMQGVPRPWLYGVLHRGDSAYSAAVLARLQAELGPAAGDNKPYEMGDNDNTVPLHADPRGLDYLEIEVRQDLIAGARGQEDAADFLAPLLLDALRAVRA